MLWRSGQGGRQGRGCGGCEKRASRAQAAERADGVASCSPDAVRVVGSAGEREAVGVRVSSRARVELRAARVARPSAPAPASPWILTSPVRVKLREPTGYTIQPARPLTECLCPLLPSLHAVLTPLEPELAVLLLPIARCLGPSLLSPAPAASRRACPTRRGEANSMDLIGHRSERWAMEGEERDWGHRWKEHRLRSTWAARHRRPLVAARASRPRAYSPAEFCAWGTASGGKRSGGRGTRSRLDESHGGTRGARGC